MKLSKNIILTIFILLSIFLINTNTVTAINYDNLINYYTFEVETTGTTLIYDVQGNNNIPTDSVNTIQAGKIGNGMYMTTGDSYVRTYFGNKTNLNLSKNFSVNFWIKQDLDTQNLYTHAMFQNNLNYGLDSSMTGCALDTNSTHVMTCNSKNGFFTSTVNIPLNTWFMMTYTFKIVSGTTGNMSLYINGVYKNSGLLDFSPKNTVGFSLLYGNIDEISYWNETLDNTSILTLYNNASGLDLETQVNETTDEYLNVCVLGNFNGLGSRNILCSHAYSNSTVGAFYCPIANQIYCSVTCTDTLDYWSSIGQSPTDMNYNGTCGTTLFTCGVLNQRKCNNDGVSIAQCKQDPNGVGYIWVTTTFCPSGYYCNNAFCIATPTSPVNATATQIFWSGDTLSSSTKMLIALLIMVITIITFTVIGGNAMSIKLGLIIGTILAVFEFVFFTVLGWFDLWILGTVVLISLAIIIFSLFFRGGGTDG